MIIYFADRKFNIVGRASTSLQSGMRIIEDLKVEDVESGVATFECKIPYNQKTMKAVSNCAKVGNYILRKNGDENEFYTIIDTEKDTKKQTVYLYAEDAGLDLVNEVVGAYTADKAYPISFYIEKFSYDSGFEIGINEIKTLTRKLSWDGESTATERLASVATQFDNAEISYSFEVKGMEITKKLINIYKKRGQDIGVSLRLNKEIDSIVTSESIANLATSLVATGGTPEGSDKPITLYGYNYNDGDFAVYDGRVCSSEAVKKWSRYIWNNEPNKLNQSNGHIIKTFSYDTTSQSELCNRAIAELKKLREIEVNYEVDIKKMPKNVHIGDRVNIIDDAGELYLSTRILKLETSIVDKEQKATLGEYLIKDSGISQKVADLANQFAQNSLSAQRALELAQKAKEEAEKADKTANDALQESFNALDKSEAAQQSADAATQSAQEAEKKADEAQDAVQGVVENVEGLQQTVENAQQAADNAYLAADEAKKKADEAKKNADEAKLNAQNAQTAAGNAQTSADSAIQKAETANKATEAQSTADTAKENAENAQTTANNAAANALVAQKLAEEAKGDATAAQTKADEASKVATEAQNTANTANTNAAAAQAAADAAKADAVAAQTKATEAADKVLTAQNDLDAAKKNLADVSSKVDATKEEVEAAQAAVDEAQKAADAAKADAVAAQSVADTAKLNAQNAQTAADNAKAAADKAQQDALLAKQAADKAQADADALSVRVTEAETSIKQNADLIALAATKKEVTETLGGYYTKEETDSAIEIKSNEITSSVRQEVTEAKETAENAQTEAANANEAASSNTARVTVAESTIKQLSDSISTLVTDENGSSLMTQTSDGWTFNMGSINQTLNKATEELNDLSGKTEEIDNTIKNLDSLADDLAKKTAYITMATDENGDPCIELGKSDNLFKVRITNTSVDFIEGSTKVAYVSNQSLYIQKAVIKNELQIGENEGFIWKRRSNGNMGLRWVGGVK